MPDPTYPKLSIITVVYNGAEFVEQALKSVLDQSYPNLEYILIDGGSTDGTVDIIKRYESQLSYFVSEPDKGIYNAMNKGLAQASGDFIGILNADDYYESGTLQTVAKAIEISGSQIIYGNMNTRRDFGERSYTRTEKPNLDAMPKTMGVFHPATFVAKKVYDEIGGFDEQYRLSADYDFMLRAYLKKYSFHHVDAVLTTFRVGGASTADCRSYEEGYHILKTHDTGHQAAMKALIGKCKRKSSQRKLIHTLARVLFLQKALGRRIERKWSNP
jgi:glycosyltransferase involved in cell wall biosynthesis